MASRALRPSPWLTLLVPLALGSCIQRGYPLAPSGDVDVRIDVATTLFAADMLDGSGKPTGTRQNPHETGVTLYMTEGGAPAFGAYVSVRVQPREALVLKSSPDDKGEPTCFEKDGAFRCLASREGFARFVASSQSDWSGTATLIVSWGGAHKDEKIEISPAGLPDNATNFSMLIGGLDDAERVLPTFLALQCTVGPLPEDLGSKWRKGAIRSREAYVRATPPSTQPGVVENAPVIVESLDSEAALSLASDCGDRRTRLRVVLGPTGESDRFYLCFSDIGGPASFAVTSGQKQIEPAPKVTVDPEPRLLRVRALQSAAALGTPLDLFEVSAYNVNRVRIAMPVDLHTDDDQVLKLDQASLSLSSEENPVTLVGAYPKNAGSAKLHVSPRLLSTPDCMSDPVSVVEGL